MYAGFVILRLKEQTMKKILITTAVLLATLTISATDYYLSATGSDANDGKSRSAAFATLGRAQQAVKAGDRVYILPGTYTITESQISKEENPYKIVFNLNQKGAEGSPISFIGLTENGQRPVFDLSAVNPAGYRVTAFYVTGQYLVFRNFEVVGIQVNITSHTQSENFRIRNGSYNTFDNIACHDGMGIGFYLTNNSHHNLFLNCDGYNQYDPVSESGKGGQNDAFGCHVQAGNPGNVFIGCRAWNNADDGFDLINCFSPVTFCYSIAYHNGYDAEGNKRQDGNGFKAGGFGMSASAVNLPAEGAPMHEVYHNLAVQNKTNGVYSNHHLGGIHFHHNTSSGNGSYAYSFVNRKGPAADENVDVDGYGHVIDHNLSLSGSSRFVTALSDGGAQCKLTDNSFTWTGSAWTSPATNNADYVSTSTSRLTLDRQSDGMFAENTKTYLQQKEYSGRGCDFSGYEAAVQEAKKTSGAEMTLSSDIRLTSMLPAADSGPVFDLQGRVVTHPTRGIYVMNGRKVKIGKSNN